MNEILDYVLDEGEDCSGTDYDEESESEDAVDWEVEGTPNIQFVNSPTEQATFVNAPTEQATNPVPQLQQPLIRQVENLDSTSQTGYNWTALHKQAISGQHFTNRL